MALGNEGKQTILPWVSVNIGIMWPWEILRTYAEACVHMFEAKKIILPPRVGQ